MPISVQEILADLPQAVGLFAQVQANIEKMPPPPHTAADYARCAGAAEDGPQMMLAKLIDTLIAQNKTTP